MAPREVCAGVHVEVLLGVPGQGAEPGPGEPPEGRVARRRPSAEVQPAEGTPDPYVHRKRPVVPQAKQQDTVSHFLAHARDLEEGLAGRVLGNPPQDVEIQLP